MNDLEARARATDELPSRMAAERMNQTGKARTHAQRVLDLVTATSGLTAAEIGWATGLGHIEAQRRLSDLKRAGMVQCGSLARCSVNGTLMSTWSCVSVESSEQQMELPEF